MRSAFSGGGSAGRAAFVAPAVGDYPCANRCGGSSRLPGVCEACALAAFRAEYHKALRPALASIPPRFTWAHAGSDEVTERLKTERIQDWQRVRRELMGAFEAGRNVVLFGPKPQVGKTSSACVMLRYVIGRGEFDGLTAEERAEVCGLGSVSRSGGRPMYGERLPESVRIARGARFVAVRDCRGESVEAVEARRAAKAATVLVFDDVGDELDAAPVGSGWIPERISGTRDVVDFRHKRPDLRTIFTTWLGEREMAGFYGGGTAKRVYEHAVVVGVGGMAG